MNRALLVGLVVVSLLVAGVMGAWLVTGSGGQDEASAASDDVATAATATVAQPTPFGAATPSATAPEGVDATTTPTTPEVSGSPTPAPETTTSPPAQRRVEDLPARYAADLGDLAGRSGVAIVPLGGGEPVMLGERQTGVAWSTIKVPIAVAAREQAGWGAVSSRARPAITVSDNDAATALWTSLGAGSQAATRVEAVLRTAGDGTTSVQPQVTRAGFTPFGQTQWPVAAQATAMAGLACRPEAAETVALMREVVPAQRWGLGRWSDAPIKGGWGPLESGSGYLVRQMGVIPTGSGDAAVAVLVEAPGGFEAGAADQTRIASWLAEHTADLPGGRC